MNVIEMATLTLAAEQQVPLPIGSLLLDAKEYGGQLTVWYYFPAAFRMETPDEVTFYVVETGHELPDTFNGKYFKTVLLGNTAYHVFFKPLAPLPAVQKGRPFVVDPNDPAANVSTRVPLDDNGGTH
jgi:hypothetical protein